MENRIKDCQLDLYADRTSTATMRANQLRPWFASMAYVLLCALHRIGLHHTPFANADCGTIRSQAAQDRGARAHQRAPHQDRDGLGLSRGPCLVRVTSVSTPRQAHAAHPPDTRRATCDKRGIIKGPPRPRLRCSRSPGKVPASLASSDATEQRACRKPNKSSRKPARSCKDSVRYPG